MLSIDGVHLENDLGLHLLAGSDETMMPETRQDTLTIPDRHGAIVFDSYLEPRRLFPQILIPSQATLNDVQGIVRKVSSLLVDEYGKPKDVKVIYDYEPDKYYIARLTGYISVDRIAKAGIFLIPLYAYDPFAYAEANAYDPTEDYVYGEVPEEAYYENTQSFNWIYSNHYSGVHNYSTMVTDFIVEIEGTVTNPSITLTNTGVKITLPSINNQKITVDSSKYAVKVDGIDSLVNTNAKFFSMVPGDNGFLFEGDNSNATVTYKWKHKFI
jgi:predicted phage tail component-like protein